MELRNTLTFLILLLLLLIPHIHAQLAPSDSYTPLASYSTNPYFRVVNQTLYKAYGSYLSQSTISSVYISNTPTLVSLIVIYTNRAGTSYRATVNYLPASRQLSIQSFGPVVQSKGANPSESGAGARIYDPQNGIGITMGTPPSNISLLLAGSNPSIVSQSISVLRQNSTDNSPRRAQQQEGNVFGVSYIRPSTPNPR